MKKKVVSVVLASAMALSLVACSSNDASTDAGSSSSTGSSSSSSASSSSSSSSSSASTDTQAAPYVLSSLKMVVDGTLTATVDNGQQAFEEQWEKAVSEKMGNAVDLIIDQQEHSGYKDAVGRILLSGDLPDVMLMSADMFKQYETTGLLWDMSKAYDNAEFQSRLVIKNINENMKTESGALYGFAPYYGNGCVSYVKKAWLDKVGLKAEDIKTFDDYYNMLLKFHTEDPDGNGVADDTYGVVASGFAKTEEAPYINYMPEFWQDGYPAILQDANGVWYDGFTSDATKAALLRLQKAYNDGLIDPSTLTASTKQAREAWFSNEQSGSSGVFTYWAGSWYQTLTDNLIKNDVDAELVQLAPIAEINSSWGGYLNREAPVWVILDDGDGDDAREQAIFSAFIETMLDGDVVQTLWTYGAEDVHWSIHAEEFTTNASDPEKAKTYTYEEGTFHLKQNINDENTLWKKNLIDNALVVSPLKDSAPASANKATDLAQEGNVFFTSNCVDAPAGASCATLTDYAADIKDAKDVVITNVVTKNMDVESAMAEYTSKVGAIIEAALGELNAQ